MMLHFLLSRQIFVRIPTALVAHAVHVGPHRPETGKRRKRNEKKTTSFAFSKKKKKSFFVTQQKSGLDTRPEDFPNFLHAPIQEFTGVQAGKKKKNSDEGQTSGT